MGRLFGTDGARGIANTELTCELAMNIGRAAAMVLTDDAHKRPVVVIGKDTRVSCDMLESALAAGLCSVGADVHLLGVVPTPAVAYLVKKYKADAGVMISASHNPCEFNGIKLFDNKGYKLPDALEEEMEAIILDKIKIPPVKTSGDVGCVHTSPRAVQDYINHISASIENSLGGMKVALDCANGAASVTAKKLFETLGAEVLIINDQPDGVNINDGCGSMHPEKLAQFVKTHRCNAGLAFDGDADRCLAIDEQGNLVDGDKMISICAKALKEKNKLKDNMVVVTVMSNLGFFRFCEENGLNTAVTQVGDRYVLEKMLQEGYQIGGEQSGHIIFLDHATTGDGQLSGAKLLSIVKEKGERLSKLANEMERYPQVMVNVKIATDKKEIYGDSSAIAAAIKEAEESLGGDGRVLVRISGTEPLIRVMVEGKQFDIINKLAVDIAEKIKKELA